MLKVMKVMKDIPLHISIKIHCECKMKNISTPSNACELKSNDKNISKTKKRGHEMIWVPKDKN